MKVDIDQFMDQGFLVLRDVIPPDTLDATRARYEELLDKQKLIWARERGADDPIGGLWETSPQPRLNLYSPGLLDETTGDVVDGWLHENTFGVAAQLLPAEGGMSGMMMCSGVLDSGPSNWHRDVHPADMGPLGFWSTMSLRTALDTYSGTFRCTTTTYCGPYRVVTGG